MKKFILVADLLGFKNITDNLNLVKLTHRINKWMNLVRVISRNFAIEKYRFSSDTLYVSSLKLEPLLHVSQWLLEHCISFHCPLRGGISYGEFKWGKSIVYGKPVLEAYRLSEEQDWIGISCAQDLPYSKKIMKDKNRSLLLLANYPVPKKSERRLIIQPAVVWNIDPQGALLNNLHSEGLEQKEKIKGKYYSVFKWNIINKITNTLIFKKYISTLIQKRNKNKQIVPYTFLNGTSILPINTFPWSEGKTNFSNF